VVVRFERDDGGRGWCAGSGGGTDRRRRKGKERSEGEKSLDKITPIMINIKNATWEWSKVVCPLSDVNNVDQELLFQT